MDTYKVRTDLGVYVVTSQREPGEYDDDYTEAEHQKSLEETDLDTPTPIKLKWTPKKHGKAA